MVSAPIINLEEIMGGANPPLQSIENVQNLPESKLL